MDKKTALHILKDVALSYDTIAKHFDVTRYKPWPFMQEQGKVIDEGSAILDIGCGNGRLLETLPKNTIYHGIDVSKELIAIAGIKHSSHNTHFKIFNGLDIPYRQNLFDRIFAIASFHHIPSLRLRLHILKEIHRVLKKDGKVIITVWSLWRYNYILPLMINMYKKIMRKSDLDWKDVYIPWKNPDGKTVTKRYYHMFTLNELTSLFTNAGLKVSDKGTFFVGSKINYYVIAEKK